jgi:ATP-dependent Clp protease adaptor protein ClpS
MSDVPTGPSDGGVAVPEAPARDKKKDARSRPRKLPPYNVVLLDDDDHTYAYVIEMSMKLFSHSLERGKQVAREVDTSGRAILLTTHKELAELKAQQVLAYGRDWRIDRCVGSMTAIVEPAPS